MKIKSKIEQPELTQRTVKDLLEDVDNLTREIQELYLQDEVPFVIGWSGGKDSSCVLQLIWNAIAALPVEKRTKTIHVITNDTLVENPIVTAWVNRCVEQMQIAAQKQQMPIQLHITFPEVKDRFWVCLMGKGYPSPRNRFRWCTDRLKIQPADSFIREIIRKSGEVILVLGTRKAESSKRAKNMEKHRQWRVRDRLNANPSRPNSLIYLPIEDWNTNEVWMYLMQWDNPWGGDNKDLFAMYRGATADSECPMVVDTSTPSCGDSRFGCWVCTMVNKDKSMEAMIQNDEEKEWLQPLLDIRNDLDLRDDRHRRDFRRLHGNVQLFERNKDGETSIEPIPGPYTKKWRETWLRRVLSAQVQVRKNAPAEFKDINLITPEELSEIRRIWLEEKHEFDDSLPRIYKEVTGEIFKDIRLGADEKTIGSDEWEILEEICDDEMHLELMSKLLDTERQFHTRNRRLGIYESLEKCFDTSSRSKEEAIATAHQKYDLTTAAEQVKELAELDTPPAAVVEAINNLLGLELAERLAVDLEVLVNRKRKAIANKAQLLTIEETEQKLLVKKAEKEQANRKLSELQKKLKQANKKYSRDRHKFNQEGGKIAGEREQIESKLQDLNHQLEAKRQDLVNLASGSLPLKLITPLLSAATTQGKQEIKTQQFKQAQGILEARDRKLLDYLNNISLSAESIDKVKFFIEQENQAIADSIQNEADNFLHLTESQLQQLISTTQDILPLQAKQTKNIIDQIDQLKTDINHTESQLAIAASPEDYQKLVLAVKESEAEVIKSKALYENEREKCLNLDKELERIQQELNRKLKNYSDDAIDKISDEHIIKSAAKVQQTLKLFKEKLTLKKLNKLETEVKDCFLYLLHKSNLINRVTIDSDRFRLELYDHHGQLFPKQRLSAGEKQLLAIAFLWGLARVSGRNLPIAIDTPLGRLDSSHRHNLVARYFPTASHQVILLSTDTEIGEKEVKVLREQEAIAQEYLLKYNPNSRQTTVEKGYFW